MNEAKDIDFEPVSAKVVDIAYKIHQTLGAGLLESIYEGSFAVELEKRNIAFERQKTYPVYYEGGKLSTSLRLDLVVDNQLVIELKSQESITNANQAQLLSYMRIANIPTGLIINFGEPYFKKAVKRMIL